MKKFYFLLGVTLCLCCFVNFSYAQEAATVTWPLTLAAEADPTTKVGKPTISGNVTAPNQHLNNMNINGYTGPGGSQRSQIWIGGSNAWPLSNGAMIPNVYNQFEVGPATGNTLNVQSISFKIGAHSTASMKARAFYSTDPEFAAANTTEFAGLGSTVTLSTTGLLTISATPNITLSEGQRLYVRIYPWVHNQTTTQTGKYVTLQDVVISGTTTPAGPTATAPVVATVSPATGITTTSATVSGNVTADGGAPVTARGIAYGTTENPTTANNTIAAGTGTGEFSAQLSGLTPATVYYARAYATNSQGTSYGEQVSFTTLTAATVPIVATSTVTEITLTSATVAGNVTADGGAPVTARGIAYSTTENPTTANNTMTAGTGTGEFSVQLSGLTPGTTYYARAYATNSAGTSYGESLSFTTLTPVDLPTVTTTAVTDVATTTAQSGGNVTNNGGAAITARGVVWSTSVNPTTADSKTVDGTGEGSFSSELLGLSPQTTYYVRAYATNSVGTAYGQEVSFTTQPAPVTPKKVLYITQEKPSTSPWDPTAAPQNNDAIIQMLQKDSNFEVTVRVLTAAEAGAAATAVDMAPYDVVIVQESLGGTSAILTPAGTLGLAKFTKPTIYNKPFALASARAFAVTSPVTPGAGIDASTVGTTSGGVTTPGVSILNMTVPVANRTNELFNGINFNDEAGTMRIFRNGSTDNGGTPTGTAAAKGFSYNNVVVLDPSNRTLAEFPATADRSIAATGTPVFFNDIPANTRIGTETTKARMIMMGMNYGAINKDAGTNITSQGLTLWRNAIYSLAGLPVPTTAVAPFVTAPVVTTTAATNLTTVSVQSGGNVTSARGADVTARGVVYSTTENPTTADSKTVDGTGEGSFTSQVTGLAPATTYYLRSYATNTEGTSYGSQVTVTTLTPVVLATLSTMEVSEVTTTTAQGGGNVTASGGAPITARGLVWSTSQNPTTADSKTENGTGEGSFTSQLTGLTATTTYYVRAYATNSAGTAYGEQRSFTTATPLTMPVVSTTAASAVAINTAQAGGNVTATGGAAVTARGIVWSTSQNPTTANSKTEDGTGSGSFTSQLTGLTGATTYYVRAYATNSVGTAYGEQMSFTTLAPLTLPVVTTVAMSNLSPNSAQGGGNVTATGGATVTARGLVWNTTGSPTIAHSKTEDGTGSGSFTSQLTGLSPKTTYYVRAYATNSVGTAYGPEVTFMTYHPLSVEQVLSNATFSLSQNYPNPFSASTTIEFEVKKATVVSLELYDLAGRKVATLAQGQKQSGTYKVEVSNSFQNGVYFYKLSADGITATRRMVITR